MEPVLDLVDRQKVDWKKASQIVYERHSELLAQRKETVQGVSQKI